MATDGRSGEELVSRLDAQLARKGIVEKSQNGDVAVTVNGHGKVISLEIRPEAARDIRSSKLDATVTKTINSARAKAAKLRELAAQRLEGMGSVEQ